MMIQTFKQTCVASKGIIRNAYMVHYPALINYRYSKHAKKVLGPERDEISGHFMMLRIDKLLKLYMSRILYSERLENVCKHSILIYFTGIHTTSLFIPTIIS